MTMILNKHMILHPAGIAASSAFAGAAMHGWLEGGHENVLLISVAAVLATIASHLIERTVEYIAKLEETVILLSCTDEDDEDERHL